MVDEKTRYLSYLLRLWLDTGEAETTWRASLEDTHTAMRHGFISLEALLTFLLEQTRHIADPSKETDTPATKDP
jgi:hypothetical protein